MGKYKQWLHHQEVGRRLRDQIASLEQERERVQKMSPPHPTTLPELDNPVIAALMAYTRQGNVLSRGGDSRAVYGQHRGDSDPEQRGPAHSNPTPAQATALASAGSAPRDPAVVANLLARAEQMPADPLAQVRDLAQARDDEQTAPHATPASGQASPGAGPQSTDSVRSWWQRYRPDDQA